MSSTSQYALLRERRFAPFFWTQFLGAANDNVFKNAFVVFVTFEASTAFDPAAVVNLIGAVFILPFMLFSATAGQIADKHEKSRLIRWIKLFEIAIMAIGFAGFASGSIVLLFVALALLGVHSTLFGPVKYAILPQHLETEELVGGNGDERAPQGVHHCCSFFGSCAVAAPYPRKVAGHARTRCATACTTCETY